MYNAIDQQTLRAGNTTNPRFDLNRLGATVKTGTNSVAETGSQAHPPRGSHLSTR